EQVLAIDDDIALAPAALLIGAADDRHALAGAAAGGEETDLAARADAGADQPLGGAHVALRRGLLRRRRGGGLVVGRGVRLLAAAEQRGQQEGSHPGEACPERRRRDRGP